MDKLLSRLRAAHPMRVGWSHIFPLALDRKEHPHTDRDSRPPGDVNNSTRLDVEIQRDRQRDKTDVDQDGFCVALDLPPETNISCLP